QAPECAGSAGRSAQRAVGQGQGEPISGAMERGLAGPPLEACYAYGVHLTRRTDMPHPMPKKFLYPPARRDAVVDNYHGTPVADPYRWLEDPQAPETQAWLEAQQRLTPAWLAAVPTRDSIKARLTELWNYPRYCVPHRAGTR